MSELDPAVHPSTHITEGGALDDRASRSPNNAPVGRTTFVEGEECAANGCDLLSERGGDYCAFHELLPEIAETTDVLMQLAEIHIKYADGFSGTLLTPGRADRRSTCRLCGKKEKGRGLCANHLSQQYRREIGRVTGKHVRNRRPTCGHPDRKHKARGLCSACHQRERANAKRARAAAA